MSSPCFAGCLRRDNRATAIVTAAASTASPMTWPPMSRTSSGRPADRSTVFVSFPCGDADADGDANGEGDTCGNAEPRSPLGWIPRPGIVVPLGSPIAGGSVPPSPAFGVGDEVGLGFFGLMSTVADAVAEFDACDEVAVAVSMTRLVGRSGAASLASTSTAFPALSPPTVHLVVPVVAQRENVGLTLLGLADSVILAVPPEPLLSQTQMAYRILVCGSTALTPWSVCIFIHSVPGGGEVVGVVVGVGVVVVLGVVDGVAFGDLRVPPGVSDFDFVLWAGAGCGRPPGWGPADEPGLGWGNGGGLALGLGWVLGSGTVLWLTVCVWLAEPVPAVWAPVAATDLVPACASAPSCLLRRTACARSTGMAAGCCARAPVCAAGWVNALVEAVPVELAVAEAKQGLELDWRVSCTPVRSMLTAP